MAASREDGRREGARACVVMGILFVVYPGKHMRGIFRTTMLFQPPLTRVSRVER